MQKSMLFLVLFCISSQSVGMHKGDGQNNSFMGELFAAPAPASKKARQDDSEDLIPPECFRIETEPVAQSQPMQETQKEEVLEASPPFQFDDAWWKDDSLIWTNLFGEDDEPLGQPVVTPPPLPSLYYLMFHDTVQQKVRTMEADTKKDLLRQFLICYINESGTQEARDAQRHLFAKAPHLPIGMYGSDYVIKCNAGAGLCQHIEECSSREFLIVQLFAHFVAEHATRSEWHICMEKHISSSLEEAQAKLNGSLKH